MAHKKVPSLYKETPAQRKKRVQEEAGRYKSKVEQPKTYYSRKNKRWESE